MTDISQSTEYFLAIGEGVIFYWRGGWGGGGGEVVQIFYETDEKKRGSYDALP